MLKNHTTILSIDDDPGDARILRGNLEKIPNLSIDFIHHSDPEEGLKALSSEDVDITFLDYQIGDRNGLDVLSLILATGYIRPIIMLTGQEGKEFAVELMRAGADDYLAKENVKPHVLRRSMSHAHERYLRRKAENELRDLLSMTLAGSIRMLMDILELLQPAFSGRAMRATRIVKGLCGKLMPDNTWEIEVAAMLCQVGCVQARANILEKVDKGYRLSPAEANEFWRHPEVARELVSRIPRMEGVAESVAYQDKCFDGKGHPGDDKRGEEIPLGARMLKLALDFDQIVTRGSSNLEAMDIIQSREGVYDPTMVETLAKILSGETEYEIQSLTVDKLEPDMVFDEHVFSTNGALLVPKGKVLTEAMHHRLQTRVNTRGDVALVREPIRMRVHVYRHEVVKQPGGIEGLVDLISGPDLI